MVGVNEKDENIRLETTSLRGLRDGMRYLKVEERIADMMARNSTRGGEDGWTVSWSRGKYLFGITSEATCKEQRSDLSVIPRLSRNTTPKDKFTLDSGQPRESRAVHHSASHPGRDTTVAYGPL